MSFRPLKNVAEQDIRQAIIKNSEAVITVGDVISGSAAAASKFIIGAKNTTGRVLGVVLSIIGPNGTVLEKNSIIASSTNQTVALIAVNYLPLYVPMEYEADLSAAAGTTTGSDGQGSFNLSATLNGTLDEGSYADAQAATTQKQFYSYGPASYNSSKVIGHFTASLVA